MKNQSKDNLPWIFRFINACREGLYYSYVLNSKQIFHWIPWCLLRSKLISGFHHGNTNKISFLYKTVYFHKCLNNVFPKFWIAKFGSNWPMWPENIGWRQRKCLTYSGIHEAGPKKLGCSIFTQLWILVSGFTSWYFQVHSFKTSVKDQKCNHTIKFHTSLRSVGHMGNNWSL